MCPGPWARLSQQVLVIFNYYGVLVNQQPEGDTQCHFHSLTSSHLHYSKSDPRPAASVSPPTLPQPSPTPQIALTESQAPLSQLSQNPQGPHPHVKIRETLFYIICSEDQSFPDPPARDRAAHRKARGWVSKSVCSPSHRAHITMSDT